MNKSLRQPILLGLAITLLVLAIDLAGALVGWELELIDLRFALAPRPLQPMTDQIVHVDIDDNAIDYFGRWPWDRSKLADVIDELSRAGAGTVALDLILSDPQELDYEPDTHREIDHDDQFTQALSRVKSVLGVVMYGESRFSPAWKTEPGRLELLHLLSVLGSDIQVAPAEAETAAQLTEPRRSLFLERPMQFKKAAAWQAIQNMSLSNDEPPPFDSFVEKVAPNRGRNIASFPELVVLQHVWDQHRAWWLIRKYLLRQRASETFEDKAPISQFASQADLVGFVSADAHRDPDGELRSIKPVMPGMHGSALQFGLAAAMAHLGLTLDDVTVEDTSIRFGTTRLPLHEGKLWIDWPTSDANPRWYLLRQRPEDPDDIGHVPIGGLVDLALQRRRHDDNTEKLILATRAVLDVAQIPYEPGRELTEGVLAEARDEVDFTLADAPDPDADDDHAHNCRLWRAVQAEYLAGQQSLLNVEKKLHEQIAGKLVFIGWVATGNLGDFISTALHSTMPGVVVNAAVADMVLTGRSIDFIPGWSRIALIILMGLACMLIGARLSGWYSALAVVALLASYIGVTGVWLFSRFDTIYPLASPLTAGISAWIACTSLQAVLNLRERRQITRQFKARVSTQLVDYLFEHPDALSVSGQQREMTVLFGDLAGFTSISESLGGPRTVTTLNRYLKAMTDLLIEEGAYVNKFLGDGLMAFWSAFTVDPHQADQACRAALRCQEAVQLLNLDPEFEDLPNLSLRIGISTGRVVVGDCGAPPALNDYTVIGDAVNLAARLESANKQFGTRILINERTLELMHRAELKIRPIGRLLVIGQTIPNFVHEVMPSSTPDELIDITARAVESYVSGDVSASAAGWSELVDRFGPSKLADCYAQALAEVGQAHDGILRLQEK